VLKRVTDTLCSLACIAELWWRYRWCWGCETSSYMGVYGLSSVSQRHSCYTAAAADEQL